VRGGPRPLIFSAKRLGAMDTRDRRRQIEFRPTSRLSQYQNTMATPISQATSIPRFLLPRLTWAPTSVSLAISVSVLQRNQTRRITSQSVGHPRQSQFECSNAIWNASTLSRCASSFRHTSPLSQCTPIRRNFSATARQARDHHFDTLKFVQRLKDEGFTEEQAVAMMKVLSDVIEER
jgi:hypothetical protein